jgi:hypothetical protein
MVSCPPAAPTPADEKLLRAALNYALAACFSY